MVRLLAGQQGPLDQALQGLAERTIIGSQSFDSTALARADRLDDIIAAFDEALGKALKRLVEWTLLTGEETYQRRRRS